MKVDTKYSKGDKAWAMRYNRITEVEIVSVTVRDGETTYHLDTRIDQHLKNEVNLAYINNTDVGRLRSSPAELVPRALELNGLEVSNAEIKHKSEVSEDKAEVLNRLQKLLDGYEQYSDGQDFNDFYDEILLFKQSLHG